ncbi:alpha/beta hydrolase [Geminocystis sp. CENA526]|uniref:alpha/beta hydrolase n=1 Tax=Geminocystis sp. CENA526 TaxID=1355871 RepID=UPI003D6E45A2
MFYLTRYYLIISILIGFVFYPFQKATGAETIVLRYSMLRPSIPVADLTNLCETGEVSSALASYLRLANQKQDNVRNALCRKIPVDGVMLSKMLNHPLGGMVLNIFAEVITTPSQRASKESLRGAIVTSALKDNNISIMEVAQNYPTEEVHINGDRLMEIYNQIDSILGSLPLPKRNK